MRITKDILDNSPTLSRLILQYKRQGASNKQIAEKLELKGIKISTKVISSFLKGMQAKIQNEIQVNSQARKEILNTAKQMRQVNQKLWEVVKFLEEQVKDPKQGVYASSVMINALDKINKQIELSNKIAGNILNASNTQITNNYMSITASINNYLVELEKQGKIKILKS